MYGVPNGHFEYGKCDFVMIPLEEVGYNNGLQQFVTGSHDPSKKLGMATITAVKPGSAIVWHGATVVKFPRQGGGICELFRYEGSDF